MSSVSDHGDVPPEEGLCWEVVEHCPYVGVSHHANSPLHRSAEVLEVFVDVFDFGGNYPLFAVPGLTAAECNSWKQVSKRHFSFSKGALPLKTFPFSTGKVKRWL